MKHPLIRGFLIFRRVAKVAKVIRFTGQTAKWSLVFVVLAGLVAVCTGQPKSRRALLKIIQLPEPKLKGQLSLEEVLAKRQPVQQFTAQQLSYTQISQLAWAGQGVVQEPREFLEAPPEESINPMSLYFATQEGVFAYKPRQHNLVQISNRDVRMRLSGAALGQQAIAEAPCDIVIAGAVRQIASRQRNKARRQMLLEAGHIAQNIQLQAVSLGLGSVPVGDFSVKEVSKAAGLPTNLEPLYIMCVGYPAKLLIPEGEREETIAQGTGSLRITRAVLIVASENFRDEELFETELVLEDAGVETVTASTRTGPIRGMLGGIAEARIILNEIVVDDYDAIVFIGGIGAREYFNNAVAWDIAREAADKGKVLGAICIAPSILANAGVLNGVRVTGFPSERAGLQRAGAMFTGNPVERDGPVITASEPEAAPLFGEAIANAIIGR
ncbi:MAG: DJ-1/PfpI family protein [Planctomycetota bacterium]|jgi:protease I